MTRKYGKWRKIKKLKHFDTLFNEWYKKNIKMTLELILFMFFSFFFQLQLWNEQKKKKTQVPNDVRPVEWHAKNEKWWVRSNVARRERERALPRKSAREDGKKISHLLTVSVFHTHHTHFEHIAHCTQQEFFGLDWLAWNRAFKACTDSWFMAMKIKSTYPNLSLIRNRNFYPKPDKMETFAAFTFIFHLLEYFLWLFFFLCISSFISKSL